jgi:hypothetical protein
MNNANVLVVGLVATVLMLSLPGKTDAQYSCEGITYPAGSVNSEENCKVKCENGVTVYHTCWGVTGSSVILYAQCVPNAINCPSPCKSEFFNDRKRYWCDCTPLTICATGWQKLYLEDLGTGVWCDACPDL